MINLGRPCYNMQQRVGEWADLTFGTPPNAPLKVHIDRIIDEVKEVNDELEMKPWGFSVGQALVDPEFRSRIGKELADVLITLYRAADVLDIDLDSVAYDKQSVNEQRRWHKNGDGTGKHIKE